ncbi:MAG TPA: heme o synthase [Paracoccus sp. (in: a-proteobacteria)]|uniref:heme o synthase n=1 Tax=uncultured Paracoccus sp. TaxID=189685 RepID=UPI0026200591|nr:heme o synthase [uncultured Paracoccus sp.]HMQ42107.1 heme o synthase [Paracoccus sp. (in: a-proteobacteria)]HMR36954.1 heme o synthase [Paracoccus sp. (in: a-proteobacteria)]
MADTSAYQAPQEAEFRDYVALLKPRVMSLVVFTAFVGLIVAPNGLHPLVAFCSVLFIAIGGGASGALNMWYDADIDAVMKRTQSRPIPAGRVAGGEALGLGLTLSGLAVMMLGLSANWFAAGFLAFTIFFYAVIYTMWLKRSTPQNIVIGGAAGAFPPMIGWACATGGIAVESLLMFALIFFWTPPHFWALALFMKEDYHNAGVPMLTVTHGRQVTRRHIFAYTLVLAPFAIWLGLTSIGGPIYLAVALLLNALFIWRGWQVMQRTDEQSYGDHHKAEKRFFKLSLYYLFGHFAALLVQHWVGA